MDKKLIDKKLNFSICVEGDYTEEEIEAVVNDVYRSVKYSDGPAQNLYFEGVEEVEVPVWEDDEE